jgi:hypothetical protein
MHPAVIDLWSRASDPMRSGPARFAGLSLPRPKQEIVLILIGTSRIRQCGWILVGKTPFFEPLVAFMSWAQADGTKEPNQ